MHCIIPHAVNPYVLCYHTSEPWSESESVNFHFTSGVSVFFIVSFRWASNGPAGLDWSPYLFHIVSIHQSPFLSTPKYITGRWAGDDRKRKHTSRAFLLSSLLFVSLLMPWPDEGAPCCFPEDSSGEGDWRPWFGADIFCGVFRWFCGLKRYLR